MCQNLLNPKYTIEFCESRSEGQNVEVFLTHVIARLFLPKQSKPQQIASPPFKNYAKRLAMTVCAWGRINILNLFVIARLFLPKQSKPNRLPRRHVKIMQSSALKQKTPIKLIIGVFLVKFYYRYKLTFPFCS